MLMKHNSSNRRHSRGALHRKGLGYIMGSTLMLLPFVLYCPPVYAIGPYTAGNKTVIDQGTGLEWQKSDNATLHTWQNALGYCEDLSLDAKTDWRLPNIRELKSLVDYSRYYPAIDPAVPCQSSNYWSASTVANDAHTTSAWSGFFGNGDDIWKVKTESYHVRCVRAGLPGQ